MHCTMDDSNLKDVIAAAGNLSGNTATFVEGCHKSGSGRHMYISYLTFVKPAVDLDLVNPAELPDWS